MDFMKKEADAMQQSKIEGSGVAMGHSELIFKHLQEFDSLALDCINSRRELEAKYAKSHTHMDAICQAATIQTEKLTSQMASQKNRLEDEMAMQKEQFTLELGMQATRRDQLQKQVSQICILLWQQSVAILSHSYGSPCDVFDLW